jgi:hypothetical protein
VSRLWLRPRRQYVEHGVFRRGKTATAILLGGFAVAVLAILDD